MKNMSKPFVELLEEVRAASQHDQISAAVEYAEAIQLHWSEHKVFSQCTVREAMHFHRFIGILEAAPEYVAL